MENGSTYVLDDQLIIHTVISKDHVILYANAGEKTILILPDGAQAEDIPANWCDPDVIILSKNINAAKDLHCTDLIICNTAERSLEINEELQGNCENVYVTYQGDIRRDLR